VSKAVADVTAAVSVIDDVRKSMKRCDDAGK
jgi:hypothetical protein